MILSIIYLLLILTALVVVHELGHYLFARIFKVRVKEFSIGFGPKIYEKKGKKTNFFFKAFLIGGYVKLAGEDLDQNDDEDNDTEEKIPHEELLTSKPSWQQFLISFAGPLFSVLAGFVIFAFCSAIWGFPEINVDNIVTDSPAYYAGLESGDQIFSVDGNYIIQNQTLTDKISEGKEIELGISRSGDDFNVNVIPELQPQELQVVLKNYEGNIGESVETINGVEFNGNYFSYGEMFQQNDFIQFGFENGDKIKGNVLSYLPTEERYTIGFYYKYFDPLITKNIGIFEKNDILQSINDFKTDNSLALSRMAELLSLSENDISITFTGNKITWYGYGFPDTLQVKILRNGDILEKEVSKADLINVINEPGVFSQQSEYWKPDNVFLAFGLGVQWAGDMLRQMVDIIVKLFTGQVSANSFTGPIGMVKLVDAASGMGLKMILLLAGFISLNLGVVNLIPLPALDGGRMLINLIEMIIRRKINPNIVGYIHAIGFFVLLGFMIWITVIDIGRFL